MFSSEEQYSTQHSNCTILKQLVPWQHKLKYTLRYFFKQFPKVSGELANLQQKVGAIKTYL